MSVQPFQVGPILGHVTQNEIRLFGKVPSNKISLSSSYFRITAKPNIGKVRLRKETQEQWQTFTFRINQNFDWSGVIVINTLSAKTKYIYQAGFTEQEQIEDWQLDWSNMAVYSFHTQPESHEKNIQFYFGSCRYPYFVTEKNKERSERTDKCFESMIYKHQTDTMQTVQFQLLLGDQIYADPLSQIPFAGAYSFESYCEAYQVSFGSSYFKQTSAHSPTYMILDDHEVENEFPTPSGNWYEKIFEGIHGLEFNKVVNALRAYTIYQVSHSPIFNDLHSLTPTSFAIKGHNGSSDPQQFWYTFESGISRFFIMDVRTERNPFLNKMIDELQMEALLSWLLKYPNAPKFIGSSVPFFPDSKCENPNKKALDLDKWTGFTEQRNQILDTIFNENIKNVFFLSGDVHASFCTSLYSKKYKNPKNVIHNLVCSPFFWPEYKIFRAFRWQEKQLITNTLLKNSTDYFCERTAQHGAFFNHSAYGKVSVKNDKVLFEVFNRTEDKQVINAEFELT